MERRAYERMEQEVRAIHRALTGEEPNVESLAADAEAPGEDAIARRFTELAVSARAIPHVAAALSAQGFAPAVDVVETGDSHVEIDSGQLHIYLSEAEQPEEPLPAPAGE